MALLMSCHPFMDLKALPTSNRRLCRHQFSEGYCINFIGGLVLNKAVSFTHRNVSLSRRQRSPRCSRIAWSSFGNQSAFVARPLNNMVSDNYVGRSSYNDKIYTRFGSCLVIPPPNLKKPRAIIKFLGGAFVGAAPEVTYSHLMYLLAMEGFLVVSVPYNVTFDHAKATQDIYERFHACMDTLSMSGLPSAELSADEITQLPLYSVGHSNGALLQLLTGSYYSKKIPKANAIISFNNRPASEAVPYFEQFGPMVSQMMPLVEASPLSEFVRNTSGDALKTIFETAGAMIQQYDKEVMVSLTQFLEQLPAVMNQVTQGVSEFTPTPSENRDYFKKFYNVPHTLLVKFNFDTIDETDLLEEVLRPRVESIGGKMEKVILTGTHITPCVQDVRWQVGDVYTPADAIAQGLKSLSVSDTKALARTISAWFNDLGSRHE